MLTIFSIPKPFKDSHIINIQTNAILSWLNLSKDIEVILAGNDYGVDEFCQKNNIFHIKNVQCTEAKTPLLNSVFDLIRIKAKNSILMYINADVILTKDFLKILNFLPHEEFLIIGQRLDLNIKELINFSNNKWEHNLNQQIKEKKIVHAPMGSDYFIFKKKSFQNLPPFAVGRISWDNWVIEEGLKKMLTIDASPLYKVIHQNHDYSHKTNKSQAEDKKNISFSRENRFLATLKDVKYIITKNGINKKTSSFNNAPKIIKKKLYYGFISFLKIIRKSTSFGIKICKKIAKFINIPIFYLERSECEKLKDCILLANLLEHQPPNSDRYQEYPWMLKNIKITSGKILDVGSTASNMLYDFLPKEVEINSIDLNPKEITNKNIRFSIGDIRQTIYPENNFDVITCISTLEHIGVAGRYNSDDDQNGDVKAMSEMKRILKPNGFLLITVPYGLRDVLPINKLYNKERLTKLLSDFSEVSIMYKKYQKKYGLWLTVNENEAAKTDMLTDSWYAIAFIKAKK
ncbi:MAG: class I SAM-dependent methyltransferase [Patescibacteria group bacterium]|nr:class I SAM-dependent methyltransferase [Patescibacteria group bacterium]MBU0880094.1 class I SAM-dependent methyltransferase [Patescibacteria group bacterium]MBU0897715.1 class I SAM-dependent methyltransferase [Patescibacteria group bacterium]MBU1062847.1 class I SAM-dependent methyltransferase [Patescibacteria group bacterium]MBU1783492.1 class I SAM-dependent methyltransferase [Patescibacteria group bacterium]